MICKLKQTSKKVDQLRCNNQKLGKLNFHLLSQGPAENPLSPFALESIKCCFVDLTKAGRSHAGNKRNVLIGVTCCVYENTVTVAVVQ